MLSKNAASLSENAAQVSGLLTHGGLSYPELMAQGWDVQLVHTELDWTGPVRWGDPVEIDVALADEPVTSFLVHPETTFDEAEAIVERLKLCDTLVFGPGMPGAVRMQISPISPGGNGFPSAGSSP